METVKYQILKMAIDCGKAYVKSAALKPGTDGEIILGKKFSSNIAKGKTQRFGEDTHRVSIGGINYLVGDESLGIKLDQLELDKRTPENKVAVYTAIALMIQELKLPGFQEVHLIINVPLSQFKEEATRQAYCDFYKDSVINLTLDDKPIQFRVTKVTPAFESMGCMLRNGQPWKVAGGETIIFDWGGLNLTYTQLDETLKPVTKKCDSLFAGSHCVLNEVARRLASQGVRYDYNAITRVIQGRKAVKPHVKTLIDDVIMEFFEQEVIGKLDHLDLDERLVFTGGSSKLFESYIRNYFNGHPLLEFSPDCEFDNVIGFLRLAK